MDFYVGLITYQNEEEFWGTLESFFLLQIILELELRSSESGNLRSFLFFVFSTQKGSCSQVFLVVYAIPIRSS